MPLLKYKNIEEFLTREHKKSVSTNSVRGPIGFKIPDYPSLKLKIIADEHQEQVKILYNQITALVSSSAESEFEDWFKTQCLIRAKKNLKNCLSFAANPTSPCNTMYWTIATLLFEPRTLGEMLRIVLPEVTALVSPNLIRILSTEHQRLNGLESINCQLNLEPVENLAEEPSLMALSHLVIVENYVFDVSSIANFNFRLHQKLYTELSMLYPSLAESLYQHNDDFKTLQANISLMDERGSTPRQALSKLVYEFRRGGVTVTGSEYTGKTVEFAVNNFLVYLSAIPPELKLSLFAMKNQADKSFQQIITDLEKGECVETATSDLQSILNSSLYAHDLDTNPELSSSQIQTILATYKELSRQGIETTGQQDESVLSEQMIESYFSTLTITSDNHYFDLLFNFPVRYYATIFKTVKISCKPQLSNNLAQSFADGAVNQEQLDTFTDVIINNMEKFGGPAQIVFFAGLSQNTKLYTHGLKQLSPEELLAGMKVNGKLGLMLVRKLLETNLDLFLLLVASIPKERRASIMMNYIKLLPYSLLHYFSRDCGAWKQFIDLIPADNLFGVINLSSKSNFSILQDGLFHASVEDELLLTMLQPLSEGKCIKALTTFDRNGQTIMHRIVANSELTSRVLALINVQQRFDILKQVNREGQTVFHLVAKNGTQIMGLLNQIPLPQLKNAVSLVNRQNVTVLTYIEETPGVARQIKLQIPLQNSRPNKRPGFFQSVDTEQKVEDAERSDDYPDKKRTKTTALAPTWT